MAGRRAVYHCRYCTLRLHAHGGGRRLRPCAPFRYSRVARSGACATRTHSADAGRAGCAGRQMAGLTFSPARPIQPVLLDRCGARYLKPFGSIALAGLKWTASDIALWFRPLQRMAEKGRGCLKTLKSQQGGELFSLLPFPRSQPQRYSSLDERNREAPKPTSKRSDRRDRELHSDSYRRSCSSRLRVVISIKGFDSPFVRTTTPALENGASTTAARKPGFSPL